MQKTAFTFVLLILSIVFFPTEYALTNGNLSIGTILTSLISISFYVFSATLMMKSRYRSWKTVSFLILFSALYLFVLANRLFHISVVSEYELPAYLALIALMVLTAGIWILRNKDSIRDLLIEKK